MAKTAMIRTRITPDLKTEGERILKKLGLTTTEAIILFFTQMKLQRGLPFEVKIPNRITLKAMKEAEEVVKGDDKDAIDAKTEALATAAQKLGEKMYAAEQAKAQATGGAQAEAGAKADDADVVDAEFTEVKDDKK